jgi:dTDP-4-dehydrorhamnose 3,5-epimerase
MVPHNLHPRRAGTKCVILGAVRVETESTPLDGVVVVRTGGLEDQRGFFGELYRADEFAQCGLPSQFVQLNLSISAQSVVRGLHFQWDPPMGKLMRVAHGAAFMVAVDLRKDSPTLGRWFGDVFRAGERRQLWAPGSFARGFCALEDDTHVEYLCTATYRQAGDAGILWNDPAVGIPWPVADPILSDRDRAAPTLAQWLALPASDALHMER